MSNSLTPVRVQHHLSREEDGNVREQISAKNSHVSVLTNEVVELLEPKNGDVVVDGTFGAGGHSRALKAAAKIKLRKPSLSRQPSLPPINDSVRNCLPSRPISKCESRTSF